MEHKFHRSITPLPWRASVLAVASCFALSVAPTAADAAGLGKVSVFSALGQPLRAEIELSATREELSGMKAQLASRDAFRQAGIDFVGTLQGISLSLDRRPNGQSVIRMTTNAPVNDPFVDMLIELNWPMGRLVREYTFLLDPPEIAAKNAALAAPVTSRPQEQSIVPAAPAAVSPAPEAVPAVAELPPLIDDETRARARARAASQIPQATLEAAPPTPVPVKPAERVAEAVGERTVKTGETLSKIANATKPEGVTLEQMLVGLLRANQEAFDGGNMNRLRSGKILSIPDKDALQAVAPVEAKKIVMAQASDWNVYRGKLAAIAAKAPASDSAANQASTGKITAKVEEKVGPAGASTDQVKISRSDAGAAKAGKPGKRSDEDAIVKEKNLKDAAERAAALDKNVANLQKLLELKDQNLAELQKQAGTKASGDASVKAAEAPSGGAEKVTEPAKVAEAPVKAEEAVVSPVPATAVPAQVPLAAVPAAEKVAPSPVSEPEDPGFLASLLENPLLPAGGAGILALLAALIAMRRRRAGTANDNAKEPDNVTPELATATQAEPVDALAAESAPEEVAALPEDADLDAVDPIAEASVYMAYGRDAQAEEILLEAKQKTPDRHDIHLKLLEIYANRKDSELFEALASELHDETNGVGSHWENAAAMGLRLDPQNPLYGGEASDAVAPLDFVTDDAVAAMPVAAPDSLQVLPSDREESLEEVVELAAAPVEEPVAPSAEESLDFDLDIDVAPVAPVVDSDPDPVSPAPLDFDFVAPAVDSSAEPAPMLSVADFSLPDLDLAEKAPVAETVELSSQATLDASPKLEADSDTDLDPAKPVADDVAFDFDLSTLIPPADPTAPDADLDDPLLTRGYDAAGTTAFDMKSITLDLINDKPAVPVSESLAAVELASAPETPEPAVEATDSGLEAAMAELAIEANEEAETKLDLAKAYEEMGDLEGARELLNEVLKEGDATQREKARVVLSRIGD